MQILANETRENIYIMTSFKSKATGAWINRYAIFLREIMHQLMVPTIMYAVTKSYIVFKASLPNISKSSKLPTSVLEQYIRRASQHLKRRDLLCVV